MASGNATAAAAETGNYFITGGAKQRHSPERAPASTPPEAIADLGASADPPGLRYSREIPWN
ncbi:hypothetical protein TVNIR_3654 [Thioalkalivibrio nitratireducens DSM 14787]|uniref:Uncharacterized protein n=1 Tax=Thioalkalivibrio nitratireducens (strain DSM 14787 / UNIQEM 213 / ALEN2) TaxID=1255043 RepID=L0E0C1_THIND|nr:hypothetical protein TVNIR_3654 [Thioalkalivibrio nitratireducens DSM 14787]